MKYMKMELENSKLRVLQFFPRDSDPVHTHQGEYQISIPLIGAPFVDYNDVTRKITASQRLVTSPADTHRHYAGDDAVKLLLIDIKQPFLEQVLADRIEQAAGPVEFAPWADGASDGFRRFAETLLKQSLLQPLEGIELQELEWEVASLLLSAQEGSHSAAWRRRQSTQTMHPVIKRVLELIHEAYGDDLSLDALAEASNVSKYHLIRLFREHVGHTPGHYVTEVRLQQAEWQLRHTEREVTAIAFDTGFGSLSAFERAFKNKYGLAAAAYRRLVRS